LTDDVVLEMPPFLNWFVGARRTAASSPTSSILGADWRMLNRG
jgi:hypothetical protein